MCLAGNTYSRKMQESLGKAPIAQGPIRVRGVVEVATATPTRVGIWFLKLSG